MFLIFFWMSSYALLLCVTELPREAINVSTVWFLPQQRLNRFSQLSPKIQCIGSAMRWPRTWCTDFILTVTIYQKAFQSSFPVIHKVGNAGVFVLLKFENIVDREINQFNLSSEHHNKCKFVLIPIPLLNVFNLFSNANVANFVYYGKPRMHKGMENKWTYDPTNGLGFT